MIPRRIVAVGTSSFFGNGDSGHGGFIGRLKVWHEGENEDNFVFNLGVSLDKEGETTTELIKRIVSEASIRNPELIFLSSGINDIRRSGSKDNPSATSPQQFEKNISEMIARARSVTQSVIFISTFPINEKHDRAGNYLLPQDAKNYAAITKRVCEKESVPYLDIFSEWSKINYSDFLSSDGVHSNPQGYEKIFTSLKQFLLNLYK